MSSLQWIALILFLVVGYFTGILRPTGLLSSKPGILTWRGYRLIFLILVALVFSGVGAMAIWQRLQIDLEGTIVARQDSLQSRETHGPTTVYRLQRSDGSVTSYTATTNDPSLPRTLPIGASVAKRRWELAYAVNGQPVNDFPLMGYVGFLAAGLACLTGAGVIIARRGSKPLTLAG